MIDPIEGQMTVDDCILLAESDEDGGCCPGCGFPLPWSLYDGYTHSCWCAVCGEDAAECGCREDSE